MSEGSFVPFREEPSEDIDSGARLEPLPWQYECLCSGSSLFCLEPFWPFFAPGQQALWDGAASVNAARLSCAVKLMHRPLEDWQASLHSSRSCPRVQLMWPEGIEKNMKVV